MGKILPTPYRPSTALPRDFLIGFSKRVLPWLLVLVMSCLITNPFGVVGAESSIPDKTKIMKDLNPLGLPSGVTEDLATNFFVGLRKGLLRYRGPTGMNQLVDLLNSPAIGSQKAADILDLFGDAIGDELPVFMMTNTAIRLFQKGAPARTVVRRVKENSETLRKVDRFVRDSDLNLPREAHITLANSLAKSLELFLGEVMADPQVALSDKARLRQTIHKELKYTDLEASLPSSPGENDAGRPETSKLSQFLSSEETIQTLISLARQLGGNRAG